MIHFIFTQNRMSNLFNSIVTYLAYRAAIFLMRYRENVLFITKLGWNTWKIDECFPWFGHLERISSEWMMKWTKKIGQLDIRTLILYTSIRGIEINNPEFVLARIFLPSFAPSFISLYCSFCWSMRKAIRCESDTLACCRLTDFTHALELLLQCLHSSRCFTSLKIYWFFFIEGNELLLVSYLPHP